MSSTSTLSSEDESKLTLFFESPNGIRAKDLILTSSNCYCFDTLVHQSPTQIASIVFDHLDESCKVLFCNLRDEQTNCLLDVAALKGDLIVFRYIVDIYNSILQRHRGATSTSIWLSMLGDHNRTILHQVAENSDSSAINKILSLQELLPKNDFTQLTLAPSSLHNYPLHVAAQYGSLESFKFFMKFFSKKHQPPKLPHDHSKWSKILGDQDRNILHFISSSSSGSAAKKLAYVKSELSFKYFKTLCNSPDKIGNYPLHISAKSGSFETFQILFQVQHLSKNVNNLLNFKGMCGGNVLHLIATCSDASAIQKFNLLKTTSHLKALQQLLLSRTDNDNSPLFLAAQSGSFKIFEALLDSTRIAEVGGELLPLHTLTGYLQMTILNSISSSHLSHIIQSQKINHLQTVYKPNFKSFLYPVNFGMGTIETYQYLLEMYINQYFPDNFHHFYSIAISSCLLVKFHFFHFPAQKKIENFLLVVNNIPQPKIYDFLVASHDPPYQPIFKTFIDTTTNVSPHLIKKFTIQLLECVRKSNNDDSSLIQFISKEWDHFQSMKTLEKRPYMKTILDAIYHVLDRDSLKIFEEAPFNPLKCPAFRYLFNMIPIIPKPHTPLFLEHFLATEKIRHSSLNFLSQICNSLFHVQQNCRKISVTSSLHPREVEQFSTLQTLLGKITELVKNQHQSQSDNEGNVSFSPELEHSLKERKELVTSLRNQCPFWKKSYSSLVNILNEISSVLQISLVSETQPIPTSEFPVSSTTRSSSPSEFDITLFQKRIGFLLFKKTQFSKAIQSLSEMIGFMDFHYESFSEIVSCPKLTPLEDLGNKLSNTIKKLRVKQQKLDLEQRKLEIEQEKPEIERQDSSSDDDDIIDPEIIATRIKKLKEKISKYKKTISETRSNIISLIGSLAESRLYLTLENSIFDIPLSKHITFKSLKAVTPMFDITGTQMPKRPTYKAVFNGIRVFLKAFNLVQKESFKGFQRESHALQHLKFIHIRQSLAIFIDHLPNTTTLYGFIIYPWVDHSFDQFFRLEKFKSFENSEKISLFFKSIICLSKLHDIGFVHSDISPTNFLVRESDSFVFLSDLDQVRAFGDRIQVCEIHPSLQTTTSNSYASTPIFTAPERFQRTPIHPSSSISNVSFTRATPKSDVYSLGLVFASALDINLQVLGPDHKRNPSFISQLSSKTKKIHPSLGNLLKIMTTADPLKRPLLSDLFNHPVFTNHNSHLATPVAKNKQSVKALYHTIFTNVTVLANWQKIQLPPITWEISSFGTKISTLEFLSFFDPTTTPDKAFLSSRKLVDSMAFRRNSTSSSQGFIPLTTHSIKIAFPSASTSTIDAGAVFRHFITNLIIGDSSIFSIPSLFEAPNGLYLPVEDSYTKVSIPGNQTSGKQLSTDPDLYLRCFGFFLGYIFYQKIPIHQLPVPNLFWEILLTGLPSTDREIYQQFSSKSFGLFDEINPLSFIPKYSTLIDPTSDSITLEEHSLPKTTPITSTPITGRNIDEFISESSINQFIILRKNHWRSLNCGFEWFVRLAFPPNVIQFLTQDLIQFNIQVLDFRPQLLSILNIKSSPDLQNQKELEAKLDAFLRLSISENDSEYSRNIFIYASGSTYLPHFQKISFNLKPFLHLDALFSCHACFYTIDVSAKIFSDPHLTQKDFARCLKNVSQSSSFNTF